MSGDTWDICRSLSLFRLRGCHPLQLAFPCHSPRNEVCNFLDSCGESSRSHNTGAATAATLTLCRFGLIPVRSPLLGKSSFLSFPAGTEMFQFSAFPPLARFQELSPGRLPDLGDLRIIACSAAPRSLSQPCHVLHRLWTPRHPPFTLSSLTISLVLYPRSCNSPCFQRSTKRQALRVVSLILTHGIRWHQLVEATGFEPTTAWLQTRCSTN